MLSALTEKAHAKNLNPQVFQAFLEDLNLSEKFDLIFIPSSSIGLLLDLQQVQLALKKIYAHLAPGGTFVFEVETVKAVSRQFNLWRGSVWERKDGKYIIANFLDLPLRDNVVTTLCKYELAEGNRLIQTELEMLKVRLYDPAHLMGLLTAVGFVDIKMLKAFDTCQSAGVNDEEIVCECRK